jgi:RND family efflux transporter MFP subunit
LRPVDHASVERRGDGGRAPGSPMNVAPGAGRRLQILAGGVAILLLVGFFVVHQFRSREESLLAQRTAEHASAPALVDVVTARPSPTTQTLTLPGDTAAWYESTIYARVNGYVAKWYVDIGDRVRKGEVLAAIDTPEIDAQLVAAQAKLHASEALVKVREAESEFAKTTYERWRGSPKGVVSDQEREAKKADFDSAAARLNAAHAQVNLDQADVDRLTALTAFKQVTAPYDGTIIERRIDIGNLVTAGSTANTTPLYRMSQDDPMRVFVDVPQRAAGDIAVGAPARVSASELPGRDFTGSVARTSQAINTRARTLRVEVDLPNPDEKLVPGMYVEVRFGLKTQALAQVPAAALVFRASGPQVAVVDGDNTVHFRDVVIARDNGPVVDIGAGVSPGDKIVLNISSQIAEGDKVSVSEADDGVASAGKPTQ